jgi:hypothetical protein
MYTTISPFVVNFMFLSLSFQLQYAHVPTGYESSIILHSQYKDCDDDVLFKYTTLWHRNVGQTTTNVLTYLNMMWGGTWRSVLKDLFFNET